MKSSVSKSSYALGFNTRDNPKDLRTGACQALVNLFPGSPAPVPRDGITTAGARASTNPLCVIPFRRNEVDYLFFFDSYGEPSWKFSVAGASGYPFSVTTLGTFPTFTKGALKWAQVRERVYMLLPDEDSPLWILEWGEIEEDWVVRPAWLENGLDMTVDFTSGGSITPEKSLGYSFSYIRRTDAAAFDGEDPRLMDPTDATHFVFSPGILESNGPTTRAVTLGVGQTALQYYLNDAGTIPSSATHIRLWRTDEANSVDEALGLSLKWSADIPLYGPNKPTEIPGPGVIFTDGKSTAAMAGITDTFKVFGYNPVPPYGDSLLYLSGRLWIGNSSYPDDLIGRWYYSEISQDPAYPTKWQSMFKTDEYYKDTSLENNDRSIGLAAAGTDIIFLMQNSLWYLQDGDVDFSPRPLPNAPGAAGPYAVDDQRLYYLSANGPYVVERRLASPLLEFTAAEVWPKNYAGARGYFFDAAVAARSFMWFFRETLWICDPDGSILIGHYMPAQASGFGPVKVIPAAIASSPLAYPEFMPRPIGDVCYFARSFSGGLHFFRYLNPASKLDSGVSSSAPYVMQSTSKQFYANMRDPEMMADLFEMWFYATWTGAAALTLTVTGDNGARFTKTVSVSSLTADTVDNQPAASNLSSALRQLVWVVFREAESAMGRFFTVSWSRNNDTPFDFVTRGFRIEYMPIRPYTNEYVARAV